MPASGARERPSRKGQYSCNFCRSRKLRCDRPLPCTSCRSRGKTCQFDPTPASLQAQGPHTPASIGVTPEHQQPQQTVQKPLSIPGRSELQDEIRALQTRAKELEKRITQDTVPVQNLGHSNGEAFRSPSGSNLAQDYSYMAGLSNVHKRDDVVGHLERVSMGQSSLEPFYTNDFVFKIEQIRSIPQALAYTIQLGRPTPCIWLPLREEAMILLDYYVTELNYIQHVTHSPSLPAVFDEVYRQIESCEPVKPYKVVLLLSIIAHTTHVWTAPKGLNNERPLFLSSSQARSQTPMWIKATYATINASQEGHSLTVEIIQGIIILSYVICNIEGVSLRYRLLISTGLLLGREMGLHRIDHASNTTTAGTLEAEIGRRVWWYLTATDWLLAARYGGPGEGVYQSNPLHMNVNKPLNINDVDLLANGQQSVLPLSQQTDMSYFLQRIHLAEISRNIVDRINSDPSNRHTHIMKMDRELFGMMQEIPAFLQLDNYSDITDCNSKPNNLFIQAYFLNTLLHTQRCKLHLNTLTRTPTTSPTYASSHAAYIHSAHQLLHIETILLRSQHPFAHRPQRPPAGLYSIFIATIALLIDACLNRLNTLQDELRRGDLAEGLQMIADSREDSLAAAKLYESLMHIAGRYGDTQHSGEKNLNELDNLTTAVTRPDLLSDALREQQPSSSQINDAIHLNLVEWDDLFSSVSSSPFF